MPKAKKRPPAASKPALAFNHAMIYVRDLDRALRFYQGALGFKVIERFDGGYARLASPRGRTHRHEEERKAGDGGSIRLYFEVRQLDAVCRRLKAAGTEFRRMPAKMPWGWRHAYLDDPDGHEVSLYWAGTARWRKAV